MNNDADLAAFADVFVCVLIDEDVDPGIGHGFLQGGAAHPFPYEVRETSLLLWLQHALITLLVKEAQPQIMIILIDCFVMHVQYSPVSYLDCDTEVNECPMDGEKSRVQAQWPELPALEGKIGKGFLHQHKRVEGVHLEGDLGLFLFIRDIGDTIHPPLRPWISKKKKTISMSHFLVPFHAGEGIQPDAVCPTCNIPASHLGSF